MAYGQNPFGGYLGQQGQPYGMMQAQLQPMQQQQQAQSNGMVCRLVSCVDEVRGWPLDLSGAPMLFYNPQAQKFYTKAINPMTGGNTILEFVPKVQEQESERSEEPAKRLAELEQLFVREKERLDKLEGIIADAQRRGAITASRRGEVPGD